MSGSVEENSVEQAAVNSPLRRISRLTAPQRDAFGPSAAEINALGLLTQQGAPQMIGFLAGLQSDRLNAQDAYGDQLREVNTQQSALARIAAEQEARAADDRMIRAGMQYPEAANAFPRVTALAGNNASVLRSIGDIRTALTRSQIAENNAQAARASNPAAPREARPTDPLVTLGREQSVIAAALRNDPEVQRLTREAAAARATLRGFDPQVVANVPGMREQFNRTQETLRTLDEALQARQNVLRNEVMARFPGASASPASAPQAAAPTTAPAQTDEASPPRAAITPERISGARARGWTDQQIRNVLIQEGRTLQEVNAALRGAAR